MITELIAKEIINGTRHIIQIIKYSDNSRVKRVYTGKGKHIDSVKLPNSNLNSKPYV